MGKESLKKCLVVKLEQSTKILKRFVLILLQTLLESPEYYMKLKAGKQQNLGFSFYTLALFCSMTFCTCQIIITLFCYIAQHL